MDIKIEKEYVDIQKNVELLFNSRRLANIIRFSVRPKNTHQDVAQHSFYVTIISFLIAKLEERINGTKIDYERLMGYASFHDLPESFSGDIVRDFKKKSEEFEILYDRICDLTIREITKDNPLSEVIERSCFGMGDNTIEGQIVKYADIIDPFMYCIQEMNIGNKMMTDVFSNCSKILSNSEITSVRVMGKIIESYKDRNYVS